MSTDIDPRITPALHPINVREIEGNDSDETAAVLAPTETAFSTAYEALRSVYVSREKVEKNLAWTPEARLLQLDGFARKHLDRVTRFFDTTHPVVDVVLAGFEVEPVSAGFRHAVGPVDCSIQNHGGSISQLWRTASRYC